jgi:hypothetical protein
VNNAKSKPLKTKQLKLIFKDPRPKYPFNIGKDRVIFGDYEIWKISILYYPLPDGSDDGLHGSEPGAVATGFFQIRNPQSAIQNRNGCASDLMGVSPLPWLFLKIVRRALNTR